MTKRENISNKKIRDIRNTISQKYIRNPNYAYLKLIPSSAISNYDSSELALLVHDLFKNLRDRINIFEKEIFMESRTSIRYMIDISKDRVEFFYVIPDIYKNLAVETIAKMWNGRCTVQEISKASIRVLKDPSIYQLQYKYDDLLSLKTDKKSNIFLSKALNIIEVMGEKDTVQLAVNLIPYNRRPQEWKTFCDDIYDRYKKNLPIQKNKLDFRYLLNLLVSSLGNFLELILPESLRDTIEYTITGDEKKLTSSSIDKSKDASKIIDTQMAVLVESDSKINEDLLAKSFCHSFKSISGDNELIGYKLKGKKLKKANVSIHNREWGICINKFSADELSNFLTIAGQGILTKFKNIEHIATKQVQIIDELKEGIVVLGTQTFKNTKEVLYLNENGQYANLPILILTKMGGGKSTWFENIGVSIMTYYRKCLQEGKKANKESFFALDFIKQNELSYNIMNNMNPEDIELIDLSTSEGTAKLGFFFKEADFKEDDFEERIRVASRQGKEMMKLVDSLNEDISNPLTGPMRRYLNCAFQICYIHKNKSLRDAIRIIENYDIRHEYIDMIPEEMREELDDEIRALLELDDDDGKTKTNLISGVVSRIYALRSDPTLKAMYNAKPDNGIDLCKAMQDGKGIFILMPDNEFDNDMINIVSTYCISRLFFACKKRGTLNSNKLTRCTLLVDEINLAPGCLSTLNDIIGQLRKYKLRPIISAHNFKQIQQLKVNLKSVGLSMILPQGTLEENFMEFENAFKSEGFIVEDLQTLKQFETLNLIETSKGKKAFISKFPSPVPGKIEDRNDLSVSEFKDEIRERIAKAQTKENTTQSKETSTNIKKNTSVNSNIDNKSMKKNTADKLVDCNDHKYINIDKYIAIEKIDSDNIIEDLNDEKYDNLFQDLITNTPNSNLENNKEDKKENESVKKAIHK